MTFAFLVDSVPFTRAVVDGQTSLGGSESACVGLARALQARGHQVTVFVTEITDEALGADAAGVTWASLADFPIANLSTQYDVVVPLRMFAAVARFPMDARLRLLWNQDLLVPGAMQSQVMGTAWGIDHYVYVSDYHRAQWEHLQPELAGHGWVTKNGFDPADLPTVPVTKDPDRIIHISRPERGLGPLLDMWPALKAQHPRADLQICRYSSMYDQGPGSWSDVCAQFDRRVAEMQQTIGGITYLGELTKPQLYQAISEAAVMWYPGVSTFAETSCIAAVEAQACGTPLVGSYRGALPETMPTGRLIRGPHDSPAYQAASIDAVVDLMTQCQSQRVQYRHLQAQGRQHVAGYTYAALAAEWETQIEAWFFERYETHKAGVLRQLLHEDDHTQAQCVAREIGDHAAAEWCDYVMAGKDQSAEQYAHAALTDPAKEARDSTRLQTAASWFAGQTRVLDVACGNGAFALALAAQHPSIRVHGLDYAAGNIETARTAAEAAGVADRCTFSTCTVYDYDRHALHAEWDAFVATERDAGVTFDGLFVGEFIEHVANYRAVIDGLDAVLIDGARVVYTCPVGAMAELLAKTTPVRRGHVHRFHHDDVQAVWGTKDGFRADHVHGGFSERGTAVGNWLIRYTKHAGRPAGERPWARIPRTRPMPRLSVGVITQNAANDLGRCLDSVWYLADEIVIGDTGSRDTTKAVALACPKVRVIDLPPIMEQPEGFAGARNAVLDACTGDWFLWIDADEQLIGGPFLRRYLESAIYRGFVIAQTHLYVDAPPTQDIPVRLFRRGPDIRFYGCVHEQPQMGGPNGDITPSLQVGDLQVAHWGYLTQDGREEKRVSRNLPLLQRDAVVFQERVLGKVLLVREAVLQADKARERSGGRMTPYAAQGYRYAIELFVQYFDDPGHKYHQLARPWYETALRLSGQGWEQEIALAGKQGGLGAARAKTERVWVRDGAEYQRVLGHKVRQMVQGMAPITFLTDPDDLPLPQTRHQTMGVAV